MAGYLVAQNPLPQAPVVAAVITGLLGLILGGSVVFIQKSVEKFSFALWALGAVIFCLVFFLIHERERTDTIEAAKKQIEEELFVNQKIQEKIVEECSSFQFRINQQRNSIGLESLNFDQICLRGRGY